MIKQKGFILISFLLLLSLLSWFANQLFVDARQSLEIAKNYKIGAERHAKYEQDLLSLELQYNNKNSLQFVPFTAQFGEQAGMDVYKANAGNLQSTYSKTFHTPKKVLINHCDVISPENNIKVFIAEALASMEYYPCPLKQKVLAFAIAEQPVLRLPRVIAADYAAFKEQTLAINKALYALATDGSLLRYHELSKTWELLTKLLPANTVSVEYKLDHGYMSITDVYFAGEWHSVLMGFYRDNKNAIAGSFFINLTKDGMLQQYALPDFNPTVPPLLGRLPNGQFVMYAPSHIAGRHACLYIFSLEGGALINTISLAEGLAIHKLAIVDRLTQGVSDFLYAVDSRHRVWELTLSSNLAKPLASRLVAELPAKVMSLQVGWQKDALACELFFLLENKQDNIANQLVIVPAGGKAHNTLQIENLPNVYSTLILHRNGLYLLPLAQSPPLYYDFYTKELKTLLCKPSKVLLSINPIVNFEYAWIEEDEHEILPLLKQVQAYAQTGIYVNTWKLMDTKDINSRLSWRYVN